MAKQDSKADALSQVRDQLGQVSPSFCLAKWQQVTLHLENGTTHSCHHPPTHKVPLQELAAHPDALHNTEKKMLARKEMLEGKRPAECAYCWKVEDLPSSHFSDRVRKSACDWALPHLNEIRSARWDERIVPSYLEVSFSNICNFKCAYCSPHVSSKWMEEIRELGEYPLAHPSSLKVLEKEGRIPIPAHEHNPYIEAFWKWWPDLYPKLKVLRITGGEPLLARSTFKLLEDILRNPRPDLELSINTNLGTPEGTLNELIRLVGELEPGRVIKSFTLFTSIDSWGKQAEYIRYGMNFEEYWKNVLLVLSKLPQIQLSFMCTFNLMSPPGLSELLNGVWELKQEFGVRSFDQASRVMIDFPLLRHPDFLSAQLLPLELADSLEKPYQAMKERLGSNGFSETELLGFARLKEWMQAERNPDWLKKFRAEFFRFTLEYDKRRRLSFKKVFPELADFLDLCKNEHIQETLLRG